MTYRGQTSPSVGTSGGTPFSSTIGGNVANGANATLTTDASGNPVALVNPNGGIAAGLLTPAAAAAAQAATNNRSASFLATAKSNAVRRPLTIVQIGNSIVNFGKFTLGATTAQSGFPMASHMRYLLEMAGPSLTFGTTTAATNMDTVGSLGLAGSSLGSYGNGLFSQMNINWFPTLDTANLVPDIVLGLALIENDIAIADVSSASALAISYSTTVASINLFISQVSNKWPGAVIHLCGPRPDNRLSVAARSQTLAEMVLAYILTLKSDRIIVSDVSRTNALPAGADGNRWSIDPAKCLDSVTLTSGVHPNAAGAMAEARVIYADLAAGVALGLASQRLIAYNNAQAGTATATFGAFTGTAPFGARILNGSTGTQAGTTGYDVTAGANTSSADQPGWTVKATVTGSPIQFILRQGSIPIPTVPRKMRPYAIVRIISGGQNIRAINAALTVPYSGAAYAYDLFTSGLTDRAESPVYINGSTIVLLGAVLAPQIAAFGGTGTITSITADVLLDLLASTSATIQILESGMLHSKVPDTDVFA